MAKAMIFDGKRLIEKDWEKDSYNFLRESVEGYIERVYMKSLDQRNIDMWCNDEGKLLGLDTTIILESDGKVYDYVAGNVVFTRHKGEKTVGLTDDDIEFLKNKFLDDGYYVNLDEVRMIQVLKY